MKRFTCTATENLYGKSYPAELTRSTLCGDELTYKYVSNGATRTNRIENCEMIEKTAFEDKTICFYLTGVDKSGNPVNQRWLLKDLQEIKPAEKKSK